MLSQREKSEPSAKDPSIWPFLRLQLRARGRGRPGDSSLDTCAIDGSSEILLDVVKQKRQETMVGIIAIWGARRAEVELRPECHAGQRGEWRAQRQSC